jgi:NADH:ubiquinone reductase (H+-translocating)
MKRVVIVGGGYVAVEAYRGLCRQLGNELGQSVEVVVISSQNLLPFHGFTPEVLSGILPAAHTLIPLREMLPRACLIHGIAKHVDLVYQTVTVEVSKRLETFGYDHLLFATGSRDPFERLRGLKEHGWCLKGVDDMLALRHHLVGVLEQAEATSDHNQLEQLLNFVIVGAGFAGIEMCAAVADWLKSAKQHYPVLREHQAKISLVHSGSQILEVLRPGFAKLADHASQTLEHCGVQLILSARVAEVTPWGAWLEDGRFLVSSTVIATAGTSLTIMPGTEALPRDARGRIITDQNLNVQGFFNLWAGGDTAQVKHPSQTGDCPSNALFAMKHGMTAGANIAHSLQATSLRRFAFKGMGQAASLGMGRGIAELHGIQFTGLLAWVMRIGFFIWYMPSKRQALQVLLDWLLLPINGRQMISLTSPKPKAQVISTLSSHQLEPQPAALKPMPIGRSSTMALWNE